ncbi:DUF4411 family protein [Bradyrhizobium sp. 179]|uniref:DUF4411 family protein n=1 Tax=Bradyrhizobium sp. 179 TaxID=2782648 RepID=UPI00320BA6CD
MGSLAMLYLLDANVLMTAHATYYPVDAVPEFWDFLLHQAQGGRVKMPLEIFEEVLDGSDDEERDLLYAWVHEPVHREALLLDEMVNEALVARVVAEGYAPDLTDDELEQIGRDPFLIAYGLQAPADRCVVTTETPRPSARRQNRKVPDVCDTFGVTWCNTFAMLKALGFSTGWRARA